MSWFAIILEILKSIPTLLTVVKMLREMFKDQPKYVQQSVIASLKSNAITHVSQRLARQKGSN